MIKIAASPLSLSLSLFLLLCFSLSVLVVKRIRTKIFVGFTAPLINRDDKRIRFSPFAITVLGDQSSEDKDAISAASIVSRGVKKRFKYSCVSSNALSIRSSTAARRHNTHNNAYIYVCIYTNGASIKIGDRQRSLRLCLFRGESNERNVESSRFSFLKFVELKEND